MTCHHGRVRVIDFMPIETAAHGIVRLVEGIEGEVPTTGYRKSVAPSVHLRKLRRVAVQESDLEDGRDRRVRLPNEVRLCRGVWRVVISEHPASSWTVTRESAASLGLASRFITRVSHHDSEPVVPMTCPETFRRGLVSTCRSPARSDNARPSP